MPNLNRSAHELRRGVQLQLCHDVLTVFANCRGADAELSRDLVQGFPLREFSQD